MSAPTERDPLLKKPSVQRDVAATESPSEAVVKAVRRRPGPLELSRGNRIGILAGVFLANFLGVRLFVFNIFKLIDLPISVSQLYAAYRSCFKAIYPDVAF